MIPALAALGIVAASALPLLLWRLLGGDPGGGVRYLLGAGTLALSLAALAAGNRLPLLREAPAAARRWRLGAVALSAALILLFSYLGASELVYAALAVACAFPALAREPERPAREVLPLLGAVAAGFLLLMVFLPAGREEVPEHLWRAGGAAWLALLGAASAVEATRRRLPQKAVPVAGALGALALALVASRYFAGLERAGLPAWTYAVGLAVNACFWTLSALAGLLGAAEALTAGLTASAWHALGGWTYTAALLAALSAMMLARRLAGRKGFSSRDEVLALLAPGVLLAAAGFFLDSGRARWLAVASFSAASAYSMLEAVSARWGKKAFRLLPPGRSTPGTPGALTMPGALAALALAAAANFIAWAAGLPGAGWAAAATGACAGACALEALAAGAGAGLTPGLLSALLAPLLMLLAATGLERLFPGG